MNELVFIDIKSLDSQFKAKFANHPFHFLIGILYKAKMIEFDSELLNLSNKKQ